MSDSTHPPVHPAAKRRRVVVYDDYLGTEGLHVRRPGVRDREYVLVPVELLDRLDEAYDAVRAAEDAVRAAAARSLTHRNPKYERYDLDDLDE